MVTGMFSQSTQSRHLPHTSFADKARLHEKVNRDDLKINGFLFSNEVLHRLEGHRAALNLSKPVKMSRKVSSGLFGDETVRSIVFSDFCSVQETFALYRDNRDTRQGDKEGYLGGGVKLSQNLKTGEWVAVKVRKPERGGVQREVDCLRAQGRLLGYAEIGNKKYIFQTLLHGENCFNICCDLKSIVWNYLCALSELQRFHNSVQMVHGDPGIHNFMLDKETGLCSVFDFESSHKPQNCDDYGHDISRLVTLDLFTHCEFMQGYCNDVERREQLLKHDHILDAVIKLHLLYLRNPRAYNTVDATVAILSEAFKKQFESTGSEQPDHSVEVTRIKALLQRHFQQSLDEFEKCFIEKYGNKQAVDPLKDAIAAHLAKWLLIGEKKLSSQEFADLSSHGKIAHLKACKERVTDRLLREKNSCCWSYKPREKEKEDIIKILGDFEILKECSRQLLLEAASS